MDKTPISSAIEALAAEVVLADKNDSVEGIVSHARQCYNMSALIHKLTQLPEVTLEELVYG